jgi:lysophospholipase L1-like esterase
MLEDRRDITMEFYAARRKRGDRNIHLVDGFGLLPHGVDGAYVDGVHPTDHGFALMAERLAPALQRILDITQ